ncbi:hypothetical protein ACHAXT_013340 [Thalassiosira profunda]
MPAAPPSAAASADQPAAATARLARSNLLRLETAELLKESFLHVHPGGAGGGTSGLGDARAHYEAKWAPSARGYLHRVKEAIDGLGSATLGPEVALLPGGENGASGEARYRVPLVSDKFAKTLQSSNTHASKSANIEGGNPLTSWSFPFPGGSSLTLAPIGSFAHAGNAGLANKRANGNVLPVLDVAVLVDGSADGGEGAFVGGKDYLNHRYTDKRNLLAVHIAKQLSQKKHRSTIGAVHLTHVFGDARKVGLLLTPPLNDGEADSKQNKKKRKRDSKKDGKKGKNNKLRFRIRLDLRGAIDGSQLFSRRQRKRRRRIGRRRGRVLDPALPPPPRPKQQPLDKTARRIGRHAALHQRPRRGRPPPRHPPPHQQYPRHAARGGRPLWALQRGFLRGHDTFTTTTLAVLLAYLYRTKAIGKRMGSVQAFTTFMKFWGETDWLGEEGLEAGIAAASVGGKETLAAEEVREWKAKKKAGLVIPRGGAERCAQSRLYLDDLRGSAVGDGRPETLLECYKRAFASSATRSASIAAPSHSDAPVLLDPTMTLNYLARLSPSFVRESRSEAQWALKTIHGREGDERGAFRALFLETNRFWTRYDAYVRVPLAYVPRAAGKRHGKGSQGVWGRDADDIGFDESVRRGVVGVLVRALGDRAVAVRALTSGNGDVRVGEGDANGGEGGAAAAVGNSDQCHRVPVRGSASVGYAADATHRPPASPADTRDRAPSLAIGLRLAPAAARRLVDRGPPAEDARGAFAFVSLWGDDKAQLRRFRDGAIVRAAVWNEPAEGVVEFSGMERSMGGIAERIVRHVIGLHFVTNKRNEQEKQGQAKQVAFELRDVVSFIDGVAGPSPSPYSDSLALHKKAMAAFDSLADFLRRNTAMSADPSHKGKKSCPLGLPLSIDEVEPLAPCLRYSALFPPVPHPLLGGPATHDRKIAGANVGAPILIQIRFEGSARWPASLNAMAAAKCAMLARLAEGIERLKDERAGDAEGFDGPMDATPTYLDVGFRGYSFRIVVRADQELRMLRGLTNPTPEAKALRLSLIDRHVRGPMRHSLIRAVHARHPSASAVVRLAHRWVGSHMLSDMLPLEALELLVARVYTDPSPSAEDDRSRQSPTGAIEGPPATAAAGFLRWLRLLAGHDWARAPLVVDPQNHISSRDRRLIRAQFDAVRGPEFQRGPAMYIISPADYDGVEEMTGSVVGEGDEMAPPAGPADAVEKAWAPTVTARFPERVVLGRAVALARCSHDHLTKCLQSGKGANGWAAAFQESSSSLTSYSALLRVDSSYIVDSGCSSTNADCAIAAPARPGEKGLPANSPFERSMQMRCAGPKELRQKQYKNLVLAKDTLHEWQPVNALVKTLRSKYSDYAVFFYNQFSPEAGRVHAAALLGRRVEFQRPVAAQWKEDSLVVANTDDLMEEIGYLCRNVVSTFKVFDAKQPNDAPLQKRKRERKSSVNDDDDGSEGSGSGSEQE